MTLNNVVVKEEEEEEEEEEEAQVASLFTWLPRRRVFSETHIQDRA
jgi:hypothetical protein